MESHDAGGMSLPRLCNLANSDVCERELYTSCCEMLHSSHVGTNRREDVGLFLSLLHWLREELAHKSGGVGDSASIGILATPLYEYGHKIGRLSVTRIHMINKVLEERNLLAERLTLDYSMLEIWGHNKGKLDCLELGKVNQTTIYISSFRNAVLRPFALELRNRTKGTMNRRLL